MIWVIILGWTLTSHRHGGAQQREKIKGNDGALISGPLSLFPDCHEPNTKRPYPTCATRPTRNRVSIGCGVSQGIYGRLHRLHAVAEVAGGSHAAGNAGAGHGHGQSNPAAKTMKRRIEVVRVSISLGSNQPGSPIIQIPGPFDVPEPGRSCVQQRKAPIAGAVPLQQFE